MVGVKAAGAAYASEQHAAVAAVWQLCGGSALHLAESAVLVSVKDSEHKVELVTKRGVAEECHHEHKDDGIDKALVVFEHLKELNGQR